MKKCPNRERKFRVLFTALTIVCGLIPRAQNLIVNGSMNGHHHEARTAKGWSETATPFTNTPDVNDDSGPLHSTQGYAWSTGLPVCSPDGGSWQNVFGHEAFQQTVTGLIPGQSYYFGYYYCTQGIAESESPPHISPGVPKISVDGTTGYTDPTDAGTLFVWNKYEGKITASQSSVTITVSAASDAYLAFDGFYLSSEPISLPVIGEEPSSYSGCLHGNAKFKVRASNAAGYQWQENLGSDWSDITDDVDHVGAATAQLQVLNAPETLNGARYQCIVKSHCCQIASKPVSLSVITPVDPQVSIQSSADPACAGTLVSFTASPVNAGGSPVFQWYRNDQPVGSNDISFSSNALREGDEVSCRLTSNTGCRRTESAISNKILVHVRPVVPSAVKISAPAETVCDGSAVTFTANATNPGPSPSYHWKKNGVTVGSNEDHYTDEHVRDGDQIKCYLLSSETCATPSPTVSDVITLHVSPVVLPQLTIAASAGEVCEGEAVTYTITAVSDDLAPAYKWFKNGVEVGDRSNVFRDVSAVPGQKVSCTVYTSNGCSATSAQPDNSVETVVHPRPAVSLDDDPVICSGTVRKFSPGNFSSYLWTDGTTAPVLAVTSPGVYGVRVVDANGCAGGDTVAITRLGTTPTGFMPPDTTICGYNGVLLVARPGYSSYLWSTGGITPTTLVSEPGTYVLTVTGEDRCVATGEVTVQTGSCPEGLFMPNAFTPNADGRNDLFRPTVKGTISFYSLRIFNRWGQVVFTSKDPLQGWNGEAHSVPVEPETFVWTCTFQLSRGARQTITGKLLLLR